MNNIDHDEGIETKRVSEISAFLAHYLCFSKINYENIILYLF